MDFWRIQEVIPRRRVLLCAEMKLPGRAWLEFVLEPQSTGCTLLRCTAWFEPKGALGQLYWWLLYPIHVLIFDGMAKAIRRKAEETPNMVREPLSA